MDFNEKDVFVLLFGIILVVFYLLKITISPFRFDSLIVVFLFLLTTRSIIENNKINSYLIIGIIGLLLSTFLSPYGLLIFYILALLIYKKTHLL
ncbi:MAG: hypothetical protein Q7R95_09455 [bacterium]|nr:hypothetical protein [bacterium]